MNLDELEKELNILDKEKEIILKKKEERIQMWLYMTTDQWSGKRDFWLVGVMAFFFIGIPLITILAIVLGKL